ncbi:ATP-dependent DNA ligase, partial [Micromonospora sp. DH15]|nr:ATP-dependent DNA ligase [Micromonospora sp. DH15]
VLTLPARVAERGDPHAGLDGPRFSLEPLLELADRAGLAAPPAH